MLVTYRLLGVFANVAVAINVYDLRRYAVNATLTLLPASPASC